MHPKVLFICKKKIDSYGESYGLLNSARFVSEFLNKEGFDSTVTSVIDGNGIDRVVFQYQPTHVVIEAIQATPAKLRELMSLERHKTRCWIVRIHSKTPFIANEGIAFSQLAEYSKLAKEFPNFIVAPNASDIASELMDTIGLHTVYLPNVYISRQYPDTTTSTKSNECIDIGCFGAIRPLKNNLVQAVAAIKFAQKIGKNLRFHINGNRIEQNGDRVIKNIEALFDAAGSQYELVKHMWMPHDKFIETIKMMDIGMQVSFSETFNIVAADFVDSHVPIIVSKEISQIPFIFQVDPNSSDKMVSKLMLIWYARKLNLHYLNNLALYLHNRKSKTHQLNFLNSYKIYSVR